MKKKRPAPSTTAVLYARMSGDCEEMGLSATVQRRPSKGYGGTHLHSAPREYADRSENRSVTGRPRSWEADGARGRPIPLAQAIAAVHRFHTQGRGGAS